MQYWWVFVIFGVIALAMGMFREKFGATSPGTMDQLIAKGPQDWYLTGENENENMYYP